MLFFKKRPSALAGAHYLFTRIYNLRNQRPLDPHSPLGTELLTAEATNTRGAVDDGFSLLYYDGFCGADVGADAAAYTHGGLELGNRAKSLGGNEACHFAEKALGIFFEFDTGMGGEIFEIGDVEGGGIAED